MAIFLIILLIFIILGMGIVVWFISIYNSLINLRNRSEESWSNVDVQLKRRYDLIPNLVETVKGYAAHEKITLENVIKARSQAISATTPAEKGKAENFLTSALKSLFALAENYPYAMVFGVADEWAETFKDIYRTPPHWYESPNYTTRFSTSIFINDLGTGLRTIGATLTSTPSKGISGGSGGGGFSGGGFGGGGGGSW